MNHSLLLLHGGDGGLPRMCDNVCLIYGMTRLDLGYGATTSDSAWDKKLSQSSNCHMRFASFFLGSGLRLVWPGRFSVGIQVSARCNICRPTSASPALSCPRAPTRASATLARAPRTTPSTARVRGSMRRAPRAVASQSGQTSPLVCLPPHAVCFARKPRARDGSVPWPLSACATAKLHAIHARDFSHCATTLQLHSVNFRPAHARFTTRASRRARR